MTFTKERLKTPNGLFDIYTVLFRLCTRFNESVKTITMIQQAIWCALPIVCNYIIVSHFDSLKKLELILFTSISVTGTVIWNLVIQMAASIHSKTEKIHRSWKNYEWKNNSDRKQMKQMQRFIKPIGIKCGSLYCLTSRISLLYLRNITVYTGKVLLTMK